MDTSMSMIDPKKCHFSPYHHAVSMGAVSHNGGINWSYATFNTIQLAGMFEADCNVNGYRTRNLHETTDGKWSVQYHHYED